ncbi:1-(5-phosphoribosyl)-5-[(5-phosphoribosylamino)methylideneamino]imidazole-4-carboxamide isomerase [Sorangium cellulosum]|uniref:1-(5-phosphoribosyl)-5-[(5- phosphoribosylamino)methylideneamino]imidazole-4- carboxamide isomerase n=1 Tax=Sorangium cellulosum TaxID=56 RepID=UPI000CF548D5|nr:1-(5-phosphoribosyl)-5-[(5-phosphoribosylamino)methylideneamino]imidazole-4-carboxamide isomerase [Sorangium cellulosum]
MQLIPAIDLLGGQAVRLHQGRYDQVTVYDQDPAALAARLRRACDRLHVVDLEGARAGSPVQADVVRAVVAAFGVDGGSVQVGGGIRSAAAAERYLALGADRIVLGTAAVNEPALVRDLADRFPGRVVVAVDAKDGRVAVQGWEQVSSVTALDVARALAGAPIAALLYTDVSRDGTQVGPNLEATRELSASCGFPVLASGGVGSLAHLRALAQIPGVAGVIVGRALYEGAFTLAEAIEAAGG